MRSRMADLIACLPGDGIGPEVLEQAVREPVGGLYFGARGVREDGTVFDTLEYHPKQIERVVRRGFELAAARSGSLVSVDKANVLDTSRLWRRIVDELAPEYPSVRVR